MIKILLSNNQNSYTPFLNFQYKNKVIATNKLLYIMEEVDKKKLNLKG